ncbi:MAG: hypothetical protein U0132_12460 [Gemmatimonadaceae bacterium]
MGEALRRDSSRCRGRWLAFALGLAGALSPASAQYPGERHDQARFAVIAEAPDAHLAESLLSSIVASDTFPGLPRPRDRVLIVIARDSRRFREFAGPVAPEWGSAFAFPAERRIVMQGSSAGADAGNPLVALRHELAHLALHEFLGPLPPRWFDEGYASYAAQEWGRDEALAMNVVLALRGMPSLDSLDAGFGVGASRATAAYALAYRAVADLAALDPQRGLTLLFTYWPKTGSLDLAVREAYGITLGAFEQRWKQQTQRRYGALAIFADLTVGVLLLLLLVTPLYLVRRQRDRQRLEAMRRRDEEQERDERQAAIEALLESVPPPRDLGEQRGDPA